MPERVNQLMGQIKKWVINDYFTPNIKAEVVLDTLLTHYIAGIIKAQCGEKVGKLEFVTKEMSVFDIGKQEEHAVYGNMGAKIDYILAQADDSEQSPVYLVELKTTDSSLKKEQAGRYIENCSGKSFGTVFGDKLLRIASEAFGETYQKEFEEKIGGGPWSDQKLLAAFQLVFNNPYFQKQYGCTVPESHYAGAALSLVRKSGWAQSHSTRSRKYLYTMGQLLDYLHPGGQSGRKLWGKPLRLIYLTPAGSLPSDAFENLQNGFYICPNGAGSVSLLGAVNYLKSRGEDLALLLAEIIQAVYAA